MPVCKIWIFVIWDFCCPTPKVHTHVLNLHTVLRVTIKHYWTWYYGVLALFSWGFVFKEIQKLNSFWLDFSWLGIKKPHFFDFKLFMVLRCIAEDWWYIRNDWWCFAEDWRCKKAGLAVLWTGLAVHCGGLAMHRTWLFFSGSSCNCLILFAFSYWGIFFRYHCYLFFILFLFSYFHLGTLASFYVYYVSIILSLGSWNCRSIILNFAYSV